MLSITTIYFFVFLESYFNIPNYRSRQLEIFNMKILFPIRQSKHMTEIFIFMDAKVYDERNSKCLTLYRYINVLLKFSLLFHLIYKQYICRNYYKYYKIYSLFF